MAANCYLNDSSNARERSTTVATSAWVGRTGLGSGQTWDEPRRRPNCLTVEKAGDIVVTGYTASELRFPLLVRRASLAWRHCP